MTEVLKEGEVLTQEEMAQELHQVRQVEAVERGRPFFTMIRGNDGSLNTEIAGHTKLIDFDNGAAKGLVFIAPDGKNYSLGNPSRRQTHHTIINHPQVIEPITNSGFEVASLAHSRGGVGLFALFRHPDIVIPDSINWDSESYGSFGYSSKGDNDGLLHLSIAAWLDARTGKSIRLAAGYFRDICENGLVSTILGMGSLRITHNSFTAPKITAFSENVLEAESREFSTFSPKVLEYPISLLDSYQRSQEDTLLHLPKFVQKPFITALTSQPNYVQDELLYQMNLANQSHQDLTALDVLNMLTNVNRAGDNDSLMFRVESISEAFMSLLEVSAFKMNLPFPHTVSQ